MGPAVWFSKMLKPHAADVIAFIDGEAAKHTNQRQHIFDINAGNAMHVTNAPRAPSATKRNQGRRGARTARLIEQQQAAGGDRCFPEVLLRSARLLRARTICRKQARTLPTRQQQTCR